MTNVIIFSIAALLMIIISIMYLRSIQVNNAEAKYNVVTKLLLVILITAMFVENKSQTGMLSQVVSTIQTYMEDAGKTLMNFIDDKTIAIDNRLEKIDNRLDSIDKDISSINENVDATRESILEKIFTQTNGIMFELKRYLDEQVSKLIEKITPLGPGGVTIW